MKVNATSLAEAIINYVDSRIDSDSAIDIGQARADLCSITSLLDSINSEKITIQYTGRITGSDHGLYVNNMPLYEIVIRSLYDKLLKPGISDLQFLIGRQIYVRIEIAREDES